MSLLRALTKATLPNTQAGLRQSANIYFILTALVCASCTAVYSCVLPPLTERFRQAALEAALEDGSGELGGGTGPAGWKLLGEERQAHAAQQRGGLPSLDVELSYEDRAVQSRQDVGMSGNWREEQQQQPIDEDEQLELAGQAALLQGQHTLSHSSSAGWLHGRHGAAGHQDGSPLAAPAGAALQRAAVLSAPLAPHSSLAVFQLLWRCEVSVMLIYT